MSIERLNRCLFTSRVTYAKEIEKLRDLNYFYFAFTCKIILKIITEISEKGSGVKLHNH